MTATLLNIPLAIGAGAFGLLGRACAWGAERFLQAPMASTGLILVSGLTLMAGANALYFQDARHPAPLFSVSRPVSTPAPIAPVVVEPETVPQRPADEATPQPVQPVAAQETASTPAQVAAPAAIGNRDIAEMQEKLKAMGLFEGTVDGYYGPKTADAIRAFEVRFGLPRTGAATPQVIQAVRQAPLTTSEAAQPAPAPTPAPAPAAAPAEDELAPLIAMMAEEAPRTVADIEPREEPEPAPAAAAQVAEAAVPAALDRQLVSDIQQGLARLGFLQGPVSGIADEATARAIRQFQIFNNYRPTGEVSPTVREMLVAAGAFL